MGGCSTLAPGIRRTWGQSDADAVPEQPQVFCFGVGGDGGKALVAGEVRGVDQGAQRAGDLAGQMAAGRTGRRLRGL